MNTCPNCKTEDDEIKCPNCDKVLRKINMRGEYGICGECGAFWDIDSNEWGRRSDYAAHGPICKKCGRNIDDPGRMCAFCLTINTPIEYPPVEVPPERRKFTRFAPLPPPEKSEKTTLEYVQGYVNSRNTPSGNEATTWTTTWTCPRCDTSHLRKGNFLHCIVECDKCKSRFRCIAPIKAHDPNNYASVKCKKCGREVKLDDHSINDHKMWCDMYDPTMKDPAAPADPLAVQEGGSHYKSMKIQPVEYIHANGIGFLEGCAIKYLSRHQAKGGIEDVKKAKHFCDLILKLTYGEG